MQTRDEIARALVAAIRKHDMLPIGELCRVAGRSPLTVWRILKPIGYYASFNFNARFYTLRDIPSFDRDGLWFCRDVGFSSQGSLTRTLVALVEASPMGMTPNEVTALLRVRVQNQLFHLFAQEKLGRTPWGRAHVYLSLDEEKQDEQARRRRRAPVTPAAGTESPLSDAETIAILAELVRSPRASARRLAAVLSARGMAVTAQKVLTVMERYELPKKGASHRWKS
jgi:hypothetical protein